MSPPRLTASILSIGDEITLGQTTDTNSAWIARRLWDLGIHTAEHASVDDDELRITHAIERLATSSDLLIVTGGLGPTADDLTRFALARVLQGPDALDPGAKPPELIEDPDARAELERWFAGRATPMPSANLVQATRPEGAACLPNPQGTAPGLFARIERLSCDTFCLPGPPHEMKPMLEAQIQAGLVSRLTSKHAATTTTDTATAHQGARLLLTFGIGESAIADTLGDLMDRSRPSQGLPLVGTTASKGVVTCRLRHTAPTPEALASALDETEAGITALLGPAIFERRDLTQGDNPDIDNALPAHVLQLLRDQHATAVTAESCTGGLLAQLLTAVPGSSDAFAGSWVTYTNAMKSAQLGVPEAVFKHHGAVSAACAKAMAAGALKRAHKTDPSTRYAIAITGIAGPSGGSEDKPVGTVWIASASLPAPHPNTSTNTSPEIALDARRFVFRGNRDSVREWSARIGLGMLRLTLLNEDMPLLAQREQA